MKIKNLILSSVIAGSALLSAGAANAVGLWGEVVSYYSDGGWGYVYVKPYNYLSPYGLVPYVYWANTNDPELGNRLPGLLHQNVYLITNDVCAAAGATRYCGQITQYYAY